MGPPTPQMKTVNGTECMKLYCKRNRWHVARKEWREVVKREKGDAEMYYCLECGSTKVVTHGGDYELM
jgi:hypothetical protein